MCCTSAAHAYSLNADAQRSFAVGMDEGMRQEGSNMMDTSGGSAGGRATGSRRAFFSMPAASIHRRPNEADTDAGDDLLTDPCS